MKKAELLAKLELRKRMLQDYLRELAARKGKKAAQ